MEEVKLLEFPDNFGVYWENRIKYELNRKWIKIEDIEEIIKLTEGLSKEQVDEVLEGFMDYGLSIEDIQIYAKPEFDWDQMEQIKNGLDVAVYDEQDEYSIVENKLSKKDILAYTKPEFSAEQMKEILQGFLDCRDGKINKEDVYLYIYPRFDALQTRQIRRAFLMANEGKLTKEEVYNFAKQISAKPDVKPHANELSDEELIKLVKKMSKNNTAAPSM